MSQGILLFAHNNEQVQYIIMAAWQAKRINKWLNKPVSIVTDQASLDNLKAHNLDTVFDHIILTESLTAQQKMYRDVEDKSTLTFKNINRCYAWELTPYDETIVVDTDIVIQSNKLNLLWNNNSDMLVCSNSNHLFGKRYAGFETLSDYGIKFYWATVFYFKKNETTKIFFDTCLRIRDQYNWYSFVHDISGKLMRNDYVWSIALHELGTVWTNDIPFNLPFTLDRDSIVKLTDDSAVLFSENKLCKVSGTDVHVMNKFALMDCIKEELNV